MRRTNNTKKIDLAVGHFYRMAENSGKAFVGEYIGEQADEFAFRLGYGGSLCTLLGTIGGKGAQGLFANLVSSHPNKEDRIARIRRLAAARAAAKAAALKSAAGMNGQNTRPLIK